MNKKRTVKLRKTHKRPNDETHKNIYNPILPIKNKKSHIAHKK
jgi:hypothetical protein